MADPTLDDSFLDRLREESEGRLKDLRETGDAAAKNQNDALKARKQEFESEQAKRKELLKELQTALSNYEKNREKIEEGAQYLLQALSLYTQLHKLISLGDLLPEEDAQRERLFVHLAEYSRFLEQIPSRLHSAFDQTATEILQILEQRIPKLNYESKEHLFAYLLEIAENGGKATRHTYEQQGEKTGELQAQLRATREQIKQKQEQLNQLHEALNPFTIPSNLKSYAERLSEADRAKHEALVKDIKAFIAFDLQIHNQINTVNEKIDSLQRSLRNQGSDYRAHHRMARAVWTQEEYDELLEIKKEIEQAIQARTKLYEELKQKEEDQKNNQKDLTQACAELGRLLDQARLQEISTQIGSVEQELKRLRELRTALKKDVQKAEELLLKEIDLWTVNGAQIREFVERLWDMETHQKPLLHQQILLVLQQLTHGPPIETLRVHLSELQSAVSYQIPAAALPALRACYEAAKQLRDYANAQEARLDLEKEPLQIKIRELSLESFLKSLKATALPT